MKTYASVYYYDIYKTPTDARYQNIQEIVHILFPECGTYEFSDANKKNYVFDIIEKTDTYIFGRLGRDDTYKESMVILKNKDNGLPMNMDNVVFEKFTFFYINMSQNKLSLIKNKSLGDFRDYFLQYTINKLSIPPFFLTYQAPGDLTKRIKELTKITNINCVLSDTNTQQNQASFLKMFSWSCYLKKVSLKIKISPINEKFAESFVASQNYFSKLIIEGEDKNGNKDTINLIKQIFARKAKIDLSDVHDRNYTAIKAVLSS